MCDYVCVCCRLHLLHPPPPSPLPSPLPSHLPSPPLQGSTPSGHSPAALLAAFISYSQPDRQEDHPEASLSYLALKGLQALQGLVSRPVQRSLLAGLSTSLVVPRGGVAVEALKSLFRREGGEREEGRGCSG